MSWPRRAAPMSCCSTCERSPVKRKNPRNGADTTVRSRGHLLFQSFFMKQKGSEGGSCPDRFEIKGAPGVQWLFMPIAKSAPFAAFIPLWSQKREPTCCPSLPAHSFLVKELGRCRAAATLFELLSSVLLFNKPKKQEKKCKELHSLQKQVRRCTADLRFGSKLGSSALIWLSYSKKDNWKGEWRSPITLLVPLKDFQALPVCEGEEGVDPQVHRAPEGFLKWESASENLCVKENKTKALQK